MKLEIKKRKEVFHLSGVISNETTRYLKNYFNYTVILEPNIILNIREIKEIDEHGIKALEELYEEFLCMNQRLCISGLKLNQLPNSNDDSLKAA